jgi:uncharacterized SAM-binding protein YcdF (DUF218 family)
MTVRTAPLKLAVPSLLIILGAPNDSQGVLSPIAQGRARCAIREYRRRPGCKIVVTGGYGQHFNTTDKPHAYYVASFLRDNDVVPEDILQVANTANTVEDAAFSMPVIEQYDVPVLCVITSDFHHERAGLIFRALYPDHAIEVIADPVAIPSEDRQRMSEHETKAVQRLRAQGGVIVTTGESTKLWPLRDPRHDSLLGTVVHDPG